MKNNYYFNMQLMTLVAICTFISFVNADCKITTPSKTEEKLMKKLEPLKGHQFKAMDETKNYTYYLGICADADVPGQKFPLAGVVQVEKKNETIRHVIGRHNDTQILGGDGWIILKYRAGDKYRTHCGANESHPGQDRQVLIMITCKPSLVGQMQVIEENTDKNEECYYLLQLGSSVACTPEDGLSAGSIFCIILLTSVGLYLLIGFLHQRIIVGAKGLEQIPNYNMWKEFGKLQADGCDFLCRCGERQEAKMYRGIDDQLLSPENSRDERDDRLLPM